MSNGIAFIIRTLNEADSVGEVIKRIKKQSIFCKDSEVVLVDSGSTDGTVVIASKLGARIKKITQDEWSWGRSLNLGISQTKCRYVCVLSGHCFLATQTSCEAAVRMLTEGGKGLAVVYGRQMGILEVDPFERIDLNNAYPTISQMFRPEQILAGGCPIISNACAMFERARWNEIPFDENLASLEDFFWAQAHALKHKGVGYCSDFQVWHSHPLDPVYIYRKEFQRCLESYFYQNDKSLGKKALIFKAIKSFLFTPYQYLICLRSTLKTRTIPIPMRVIYGYHRTKRNARLAAWEAFMNGATGGYWRELAPKLDENLEMHARATRLAKIEPPEMV